MKKFDWYFLRIATVNIGVSFFSITLLYVAIDFIYNIDRFMGRPLIQTIEYYALTVPPILHTMAPLAVLLGGMFGVARLIKYRELLPLMASGIRISRCLRAFWLVAMLSAAGMALAQEYLLPGLEQRAATVQAGVKFTAGEDITLFDSAGNHWYIGGAEVAKNPPVIEHASITLMDGFGRATGQVIAPRLEYRDNAWRGATSTFMVSEFNSPAGSHPEQSRPQDSIPGDWLTPETLAMRGTGVESRALSQRLKRASEAPHRADYRYSLYEGVLYPLTCLTLLMIGAVMAVRVQARNMVVAAALTVCVAFGSYCLVFFAQGLTQQGVIGPEAAAFAPFFLFLGLGVYALRWKADA